MKHSTLLDRDQNDLLECFKYKDNTDTYVSGEVSRSGEAPECWCSQW